MFTLILEFSRLRTPIKDSAHNTLEQKIENSALFSFIQSVTNTWLQPESDSRWWPSKELHPSTSKHWSDQMPKCEHFALLHQMVGSLGFSILPKDTLRCRTGELNQQPSDNKALALTLSHSRSFFLSFFLPPIHPPTHPPTPPFRSGGCSWWMMDRGG